MRTFLNLATLRRGGGLTHVNAFLPELTNLLQVPPKIFVPDTLRQWAEEFTDNVVTHNVPEGSLKLAYTQLFSARQHAKNSDIALSVMNTGPINLPIPHILWACNVSHFTPAKKVTTKAQNWAVLRAMNHCDLCIFPSESAKQMAVNAGFQNDSEVLYHPMRISNGQWRKLNRDEVLKIFVPATNNPHKNLAFVPHVSEILTNQGINHRFSITVDATVAPGDLVHHPNLSFIGRYQPQELTDLISKHDVAFIPSLLESYSYSVAELEQMGMPLAVSDIPVHREISENAILFNPNKDIDAANAITAASQKTPEIQKFERLFEPQNYADTVHSLMRNYLAQTSHR